MSYQYAKLQLPNHPLSQMAGAMGAAPLIDATFISYSDTDEGFRADVLNHLVSLRKYNEEMHTSTFDGGMPYSGPISLNTVLPHAELIDHGRILDEAHVKLIDDCIEELAYLRALATVKTRWQREQSKENLMIRGEAGKVTAVKHDDLTLIVKHTRRLDEGLRQFFRAYHTEQGKSFHALSETLTDAIDMSPIN